MLTVKTDLEFVNFTTQNTVSEVSCMSNKIKVLTLGDHPLLPSGVGTQTKYMIEALVDSGKFDIF